MFKRNTSALRSIRREHIPDVVAPTKLEWEMKKSATNSPPQSRRKRSPGDFPMVADNCFIVPKGLKKNLREKLQKITWWFTEERLQDIVAPLILRTRPAIDTPGEKLSIRLLSWGLVNYAKENLHLCDYQWTNPETGEKTMMNVRQVQDMINATNSRVTFAPHRRSSLIHIKVNGQTINTAFEQVNWFFILGYMGFIHWAIDNKKAIRDHMDMCMERTRRLKLEAAESGTKFKRRALCGQSQMSGTVTQMPHDEVKAGVVKEIIAQLNEDSDGTCSE